jgi:hypothetical protein
MKTAQESLTALASGTTQAFPNIKRSDMVSGLKARIAKPVEIDQANTSLCGAASLMYSLASAKDAVYAQYVVDLYQTGTGTIGKLTVKPGAGCRRYAATAGSGIHPVDWVSLASLRDSENDALDYDTPSAAAGGITMPGDLLDWFQDAGFSKDQNVTNLVWTKGVSDLTAAGSKYLQGRRVCLFINANMLSSPNEGSAFPDHWVVLESAVRIMNGNAQFKVFTWGGLRNVDVPVDRFCKNFYGYISSSA